MANTSTLYCLYGNSGGRTNMSSLVLDMFTSYNCDLIMLSDFNIHNMNSEFDLMTSDKRLDSFNIKWSVIISKKCLNAKQITSPRENWTVSTLTKNGLYICLISVYIRITSTKSEFYSELQSLEDYIRMIHYDLIIIAGDFNANTLPSTHNCLSTHKGEVLKSWYMKNNLTSLSIDGNTPTSTRGRTRVDHLMTSKCPRIKLICEQTFHYSNLDHQLTLAKFKIYHRDRQDMKVQTELTSDYRKTTYHQPTSCTDIDREVNNFENDIFKTIIISQKRRLTAPDQEISKINMLIKTAEKKWTKKRNFAIIMKRLIEEKRCIIESQLKFRMETARIEYRKNPWRGIMMAIGKKFKLFIPDVNHKNIKVIEETKKIILDQFDCVEKSFHRTSKEFTHANITIDFLIKEMKKIKGNACISAPSKSIYMNADICDTFTNLINAALNNGYFPKKWASGWLSLIPKKGTDKWRSIVIQHPIGLVIQRIIEAELIKIIGNIRDTKLKSQFGFIKSRSITTLLYLFNREVESARNYGGGVIVDMDINCAFDSIDHTIILKCLSNEGVSEMNICMIESYLKNFKLYTLKKNQIVFKQINKGVPQGSILGPHLWTILSASMLAHLGKNKYFCQHCKIFMFADDIKLVVRHRADVEGCVDTIKECLSTFKLELNEGKTKYLSLFNPGGVRAGYLDNTDIFGIRYGTRSKSMVGPTLKHIKTRMVQKSSGLIPIAETLKQINCKALPMVIETCIWSTTNHIITPLLDNIKLHQMWNRMHDIESDIVGKVYKKGNAPKFLLPLIYTKGITAKQLKSSILNICERLRTYQDHRIFTDNPPLYNAVKNWYNRCGNKSIVSSKITLGRRISNTENSFIVKINGNVKELHFIRTDKVIQGRVICNILNSNFDVTRIGILGLIQWAQLQKIDEIQLLISDVSIEKFGIPELWQSKTLRCNVNIVSLTNTEFDRIKNTFTEFRANTIIRMTHLVGKTAIKKMINELVNNIIKIEWNKAKLWGTKRCSFNLIMEILSYDGFINTTPALRLLIGFLKIEHRVICLCIDSNIVHYITICPDTRTARTHASSELLQYLNYCSNTKTMMATHNKDILIQLLLYLNNIFSITIRKHISYKKINNILPNM